MKEEGNIHIIGQGTYGCVYSPNIECETQKLGSKKFLSKIQRKDKTSKNEETSRTKDKKKMKGKQKKIELKVPSFPLKNHQGR